MILLCQRTVDVGNMSMPGRCRASAKPWVAGGAVSPWLSDQREAGRPKQETVREQKRGEGRCLSVCGRIGLISLRECIDTD